MCIQRHRVPVKRKLLSVRESYFAGKVRFPRRCPRPSCLSSWFCGFGSLWRCLLRQPSRCHCPLRIRQEQTYDPKAETFLQPIKDHRYAAFDPPRERSERETFLLRQMMRKQLGEQEVSRLHLSLHVSLSSLLRNQLYSNHLHVHLSCRPQGSF